ncbi:anti-anti-sigma factor [Rhodococcoides kroppenstedtii]|uniref:Anti-anti-sigma factor n=1 Tax=Rhodococcoides kroppenstedtii TaxID=293050 RepID=A0A1I0T1H8_9NOCA|nr:STAS domain-containing protein [Rhodococcus kroppenstedtii]SFA45591.1 anti-anti-sigma factor [Rhodococcus kroppenstedtii]
MTSTQDIGKHGPAGEPATLKEHYADGHRMVTVHGDLDLDTSDALFRRIVPISASDAVVVDLRGVTFMSTAAVSALLRAYTHRERAGAPPLTVLAADSAALRPLDIAGVTDVLHVVRRGADPR